MFKVWYIGDVVKYKGNIIVIIDCKNREDYSSMCYDRDYKVCKLSEIENISEMSEKDFNKLGYWIKVAGNSKFPEYESLDNIAPFEIKEEKIYKIRQKNIVTEIKYI